MASLFILFFFQKNESQLGRNLNHFFFLSLLFARRKLLLFAGTENDFRRSRRQLLEGERAR